MVTSAGIFLDLPLRVMKTHTNRPLCACRAAFVDFQGGNACTWWRRLTFSGVGAVCTWQVQLFQPVITTPSKKNNPQNIAEANQTRKFWLLAAAPSVLFRQFPFKSQEEWQKAASSRLETWLMGLFSTSWIRMRGNNGGAKQCTFPPSGTYCTADGRRQQNSGQCALKGKGKLFQRNGAITTASARATVTVLLENRAAPDRPGMTSQLSSSLFPSRLHLSLLDERDASRRSPFAITRLWD